MPAASKPPRSADAILACHLAQQQQRASSNNQLKKHNTGHKEPYADSLDRRRAAFFPHLANEHNASLEQQQPAIGSPIVQMQRKLLALFYIYLAIIVSLYLTYACYCYYQQNQLKKLQQQQQTTGSQQAAARVLSTNADERHLLWDEALQEAQAKWDSKVQVLERYVELLAAELEQQKWRLAEREKCACSIGCSFNGTRFADGQTWRQKCDTCTCKGGKISCQARECPRLVCQDQPDALIQTQPGQCCPSCMKKCKVNGMLVRHGHSFRPADVRGRPSGKSCKCLDGLIKCESNRHSQLNHEPPMKPGNKTIEYLKSILGSQFEATRDRA